METLRKLEIQTIGDLAKADPKLIELHLKSHGRRLWEFANGMDDSIVESEKAETKGVGNSTTLSKDVSTKEDAQKVLLSLAQSVGRTFEKTRISCRCGQCGNQVCRFYREFTSKTA